MKNRKGWPKKSGHYWIQVAGDDFAQPCFYCYEEHAVGLIGYDHMPVEELGPASISSEPMPKTIISAKGAVSEYKL